MSEARRPASIDHPVRLSWRNTGELSVDDARGHIASYADFLNERLTSAGKPSAARQTTPPYPCNFAITSTFARMTSIRLIFCVGVSSPFSTVNGSTTA